MFIAFLVFKLTYIVTFFGFNQLTEISTLKCRILLTQSQMKCLQNLLLIARAKSKPKGVHIDDQPISNSLDDILASTTAADPEESFYST